MDRPAGVSVRARQRKAIHHRTGALALVHNLLTVLAADKKAQAKQATGSAVNPGPDST